MVKSTKTAAWNKSAKMAKMTYSYCMNHILYMIYSLYGMMLAKELCAKNRWNLNREQQRPTHPH